MQTTTQTTEKTDEKYRQLIKDCPICKGVGAILSKENGYSYAKICSCIEEARKKIKAEMRLEFANVPEPLMNVKIRDFDPNLYKDSKSVSLANNVLKSVCYFIRNIDEFMVAGKGLYIYSEAKGSGKTMIAAAIANKLLESTSYAVKFATMVDILKEIKSTYDNDSQINESELLDSLNSVDILVIDDIGVETPTAWVRENVQQIMNTRCLNKQITIFTSNVHINELKYDGRVRSRINEMAIILKMPEESIRDMRAENDNYEWTKKMLGVS